MSSTTDEEMMDPDDYLDDPDHDWSRLSVGGETVIETDDGYRILIEQRVTYAIIAPDDEALDLDHSQPWGPTYRKEMDPSYPEGMIEEVRGRLAAHRRQAPATSPTRQTTRTRRTDGPHR